MQRAIPDRKEFDAIYDLFAPLVYGIACRITQAANQQEEILAKTFEELYNRENIEHINTLRVQHVLAATFKSIYIVLFGLLPPEEIRYRVKEEQDRLLQSCGRAAAGGLQKFASESLPCIGEHKLSIEPAL